MKFLAVFALAVACASADVSHLIHSADAAAQVVRSSYDAQPEGSYSYGFETSNNIAAQASGVIKDPNSENPIHEVQGQFRYVGPDGVDYVVNYVANENGFQPQGAHLPVAPEVPEAIARSLAYNAAHPAKAVSEPFVQAARVVQPAFQPQTYKPQAYKPQAFKPRF